MELNNQVPENITKRKFIADLLSIPPMLLGLGVLENVTLKPHPNIAGAQIVIGRITLPKVKLDTTSYQKRIRTLLTLHHTSQAQSELDQINADIRDLESLESQAHGDLLYHIQEILFTYQTTIAKMVRDERKFSLSHHHANEAVRVAKAMQDIDLIGTGLYIRGRTYLDWGMFGTLEKGVFQVQVDKIDKAIRDFEDAKKTPENAEKSIHPQLAGLIDMHLSQAYTIRNLSMGEKIPTLAITLLDGAEENVDRQSIDDPYTRELVTGSRLGFMKTNYHNTKAAALNAAGRPGAALKELNTSEALHPIGKDLTREQAWLDTVAARALMGLKQYKEAIIRAKRALVASQDINFVTNLAKVIDIHGRLLQSSCKNEPDVKELGDMIDETIVKQEKERLVEEKDY